MKRFLAVLVLLAMVTPAGSQTGDLKAALESCRKVSDSLQRLVCYDNLAGAPASTAATPTGGTTAVQPFVATPERTPARAASSQRCAATTKKGAQCSRMAKAGSSYCWQHGG